MGLTPDASVDRLIEAGHVLEDAGDSEGALARYREAIAIAPGYARAHMNAGNALRNLERWDEALAAQRAAIACAPDRAPAHFNLGALLLARARLPEAERELLRAAELDPAMAEAPVMLADLYETAQRYDEAEAQFERALSLAPEHGGTVLNFGMFCMRQGRYDDAIALLMRAKALEPRLANVESFLLWSLNFATDRDAEAIAARHRAIGAEITRIAGPPFVTWPNAVDPERPLRVGYVSGDFLNHPVSLFLRPVLERHDRRNVETFCYSNYSQDNEVAQVLRRRSDHWRDISAMSDERFADALRRDLIDILVDLSGHTNRNRLAVFARHPAPVQATWLGYLNTTGLPAMDYRICDRHTDPEGATEALHTERLVRMPHSQWCYAPWFGIERISVADPPSRDAVVFGSFNQLAKVSEACLALWCEVLSGVPGASLVVLDVRQPETGRALLERIERHGISRERVVLRGRESMADYFAAIGRVDVALDTFPYNGGTTTLDTLWMGVPIVALRGERGISRGCYSILKSLGADELIAYDPVDYVKLNVRLARDRPWRARLRETLRARLVGSPLMNSKQFVADLEARYRTMWRAFCTGASAG